MMRRAPGSGPGGGPLWAGFFSFRPARQVHAAHARTRFARFARCPAVVCVVCGAHYEEPLAARWLAGSQWTTHWARDRNLPTTRPQGWLTPHARRSFPRVTLPFFLVLMTTPKTPIHHSSATPHASRKKNQKIGWHPRPSLNGLRQPPRLRKISMDLERLACRASSTPTADFRLGA